VEPKELPLPAFYEAANASRWAYRPDQEALLTEALRWTDRHRIGPSASDRTRIHLLLIDVQKDFCFPEGSLYVAGRSGRGALDDNDRTARFVHRNLALISEITCTMDTHDPFQIFSPAFWQDEEGRALAAHREITTEDIRRGRVQPNPALASWLCGGDQAWLLRQVEFYASELERAGKYRLYLWPPHCILGSEGHALVGVVHEARLFHAYARGARNTVEVKGGHPLTENYSVLAPEVLLRHDGGTLAERNTALVETLLGADVLVVAGQAASHCVKSTLEDLLAAIEERDPALARKVYVLRDCMSAVAVPDPACPGTFLFDFTPQAEGMRERMMRAGMHVVESVQPLASWPGITL